MEASRRVIFKLKTNVKEFFNSNLDFNFEFQAIEFFFRTFSKKKQLVETSLFAVFFS
jgi:hypothetical protein